MKPRDYFDKKADVYDKERNSGLIGSLVNKERDLVLRFLKPEKNDKILDAGCGSGYYSLILKEMGIDVYGVDISENMIKKLKEKGIGGEVANLEDFNLRKTFDKIVCGGAMEFVRDPLKAFQQINRHLKPNGLFVLVYPRFSIGGILYKMFHLSHNVRIQLFSKVMINDFLNRSHFSLLENRNSDLITSVLVAKKR